jgi:hypothetical protein
LAYLQIYDNSVESIKAIEPNRRIIIILVLNFVYSDAEKNYRFWITQIMHIDHFNVF